MIIRRIKNYLRDSTWGFLKARWKLRSGISIAVENDSDWFVFNEVFTNKEYDPALHHFLRQLSSQPLILDLGANVGYFSIRVADELEQAGCSDYRIIALEASPSNFAVLSRRVNQSLLSNKVNAVPGLAGYKIGSHEVVHSQQHYGHSAAMASSHAKTALVNYVDIEILIGDAERRVDLLKCDIEGSEEIFISTYPALLARIDTAVFEFHAGECNIANCRRLLEEAGLFSKGVIKEEMNYQTSVELFSRL